jgi:hypothetical protein
MEGRKLEKLVLFILAFIGLGLAPTLWAIGSYFHLIALPWSLEYLTTLYCIFMVVAFAAFYPAVTMVQGINIAKYNRAMAELDEMNKEFQ